MKINNIDYNITAEKFAELLAASRSRGRSGGRKLSLTQETFTAAKKLLGHGDEVPNISEIARSLHTSPRTIRRIVDGAYDDRFI